MNDELTGGELTSELACTRTAQQWLPEVYDELRRLAAYKLSKEPPGQTLQPTALVHEVYDRLMSASEPRTWLDSREFFMAAAEAMRRILIDRARHKRCVKKGGQFTRIEMSIDIPAPLAEIGDHLLFDEAIQRLEQHDAEMASYVKLRYFGDCSHNEAASMLGISCQHAKRLKRIARAWLAREIFQ